MYTTGVFSLDYKQVDHNLGSPDHIGRFVGLETLPKRLSQETGTAEQTEENARLVFKGAQLFSDPDPVVAAKAITVFGDMICSKSSPFDQIEKLYFTRQIVAAAQIEERDQLRAAMMAQTKKIFLTTDLRDAEHDRYSAATMLFPLLKDKNAQVASEVIQTLGTLMIAQAQEPKESSSVRPSLYSNLHTLFSTKKTTSVERENGQKVNDLAAALHNQTAELTAQFLKHPLGHLPQVMKHVFSLKN